MDPQVPADLRRVEGDVVETPMVVLLRKIEFSFCFLFLGLAAVCILLPLVYDSKTAPLLVAAAFSIGYSIAIYCLRFRFYVHFGLMLHLGLLLIFTSTIFFEIELYRTGTALVIIGIFSVLIIFVFGSLGRKVIVRNEPSGGRQNQPRPGMAQYFANRLRDQDNNHVLPDARINNLNLVLANGPINRVNPDDAVNHPDQLDLNQGLPNGHAIPVREDDPDEQIEEQDPDEQMDQQRDEDPNEVNVQPVENANEQVRQREVQD